MARNYEDRSAWNSKTDRYRSQKEDVTLDLQFSNNPETARASPNSFVHLKQFVDLLKFDRAQFTRFALKLFHVTWIIRPRTERSAVSRVIAGIRFCSVQKARGSLSCRVPKILPVVQWRYRISRLPKTKFARTVILYLNYCRTHRWIALPAKKY